MNRSFNNDPEEVVVKKCDLLVRNGKVIGYFFTGLPGAAFCRRFLTALAASRKADGDQQ